MPSNEAEQTHKRILVVEDDDSLRDLLCRNLTRFGFETVRACNGEEAFEVFSNSLLAANAASRLDAVVTDYLMPRTDGADFIRKIKSVRPEFPVVLVTGEAPDAVILQLAALPRVIALLKPFRPEGFRQGLSSVLREPLRDGRPEMRRATRVEVAISCAYSEASAQEGNDCFASVRNLGFGGCYLQSEQILPVGSPIRLFFQGLDRHVLTGRVVWNDATGMGISLTPDRPETHLFFQKFVLNKLKQKGIGIMGVQPDALNPSSDGAECV